jgi:hypothetical protein
MSITTDSYTPAGDTDDGIDTDQDLDDLLDDEPDTAADHDEAAPSSPHSPAARAKSGANRGLIRRVANKAAELAAADAGLKETLASMLGCTTDLGDLTYAVMAADRTALAPAADLTAIAAEDAFSAATVATTQGRVRMRGVWSLLLTLGADLPATIPPSDAKAAIALARACLQLEQSAKDDLKNVVALARKS